MVYLIMCHVEFKLLHLYLEAFYHKHVQYNYTSIHDYYYNFTSVGFRAKRQDNWKFSKNNDYYIEIHDGNFLKMFYTSSK